MEGEQVELKEEVKSKKSNGGKAPKVKKDKIYGFENYDAKRLHEELEKLGCNYKNMSKWPVDVKKIMLKFHIGLDKKKKDKAERKKKLAEEEKKVEVVAD